MVDVNLHGRVTVIEGKLDRIVGPHESNGRLGRAETELAALRRRYTIAIGALVSLALAAAGSGYAIVTRMNERAREAGRADERDRLQELRLDRVEGFLLGAGLLYPRSHP